MAILAAAPRNRCFGLHRKSSARISAAYKAVPLFGSFHGTTARPATLRTTTLFSRFRKHGSVNSVVEKMLLIAKRNAFPFLHSGPFGVKLIIWNRSNHEFLKPVTA